MLANFMVMSAAGTHELPQIVLPPLIKQQLVVLSPLCHSLDKHITSTFNFFQWQNCALVFHNSAAQRNPVLPSHGAGLMAGSLSSLLQTRYSGRHQARSLFYLTLLSTSCYNRLVWKFHFWDKVSKKYIAF